MSYNLSSEQSNRTVLRARMCPEYHTEMFVSYCHQVFSPIPLLVAVIY